MPSRKPALRQPGPIPRPLSLLGRLAVKDVSIRDETVRSGDVVLVVIAAANSDPAKFENPDRLDITRQHLQRMAFGHGHHFCACSPLSRLEERIDFETLLKLPLDRVQHFTYA
jgi:cytochrome P450